jgi:hypothetical protein
LLIDLIGMTFLAAAGVRTLIRDTAPTATAGRTSRATPPRTSPASSNCWTSTDSPTFSSAAEGAREHEHEVTTAASGPDAEEAATAELDNVGLIRLGGSAVHLLSL